MDAILRRSSLRFESIFIGFGFDEPQILNFKNSLQNKIDIFRSKCNVLELNMFKAPFDLVIRFNLPIFDAVSNMLYFILISIINLNSCIFVILHKKSFQCVFEVI